MVMVMLIGSSWLWQFVALDQDGTAMGRVPTQIDFDDYRNVAGVKVPFKWAFAWVSGRDVVELTEVQPNVAIDPARFTKPTPAVAGR